MKEDKQEICLDIFPIVLQVVKNWKITLSMGESLLFYCLEKVHGYLWIQGAYNFF